MRNLLLVLPFAVVLAAASPGARATDSQDSCEFEITSLPAVITSPGQWCLKKHLGISSASGNAIQIATNNVTLDCNGFRISGLGAGAGTSAVGISVASKLNAAIRHCHVRGFHRGVYATEGGGHVIEDNTIEGSTYSGITSTTANSTLRRNLVLDTGGSTINQSASYGIVVGSEVDVIDNTIASVDPLSQDGNATGINSASDGGGTIVGNRIRDLRASGTGTEYGIRVVSGTTRTIVEGNLVQGSLRADSVGISCGFANGTASRNVIAGFATGVEGCTEFENTFNVY